MHAPDPALFAAIDQDLQRRVDRDELAGVSYAVVRGGQVLARRCIGWADREAREPLREDHLFRAYSNTKLVTSMAVLQLVQEGPVALDDPVERFIPAFAQARVLRSRTGPLHETEPLREPVRLRHLLTHTAGLSYAFMDPESPLAKAYLACGTRDPQLTLAEMVERAARLPLLFPPGSAWSYSVGIDLAGRVLEIVDGAPLDQALQRRVLGPLGMRDTGFVVPPAQQHRLAALYIGDLLEPSRPGLRRADDLPYPDAYRKPFPRLNPGGGLVTSLDDYTRLVQAVLRRDPALLRTGNWGWVFDNQLPPGMSIGFPDDPVIAGRGHSFAGSVSFARTSANPHVSAGDLEWGGMAGTHWLVSPANDYALVLMTQRMEGFGLPFWTEFKKRTWQALASAGGSAPD